MKQNKIDYYKTWPYCLNCGKTIKLPDGKTVTLTTYEGLKGICNDCHNKSKGEIKNEKS